MKTYKIWNKVDAIKGIDAQHFIENLKINENDDVFLVLDENENVIAVESGKIIKSVYSLDVNLTIEQVAQEYLRIKAEEEEKAKESQVTLEEQANKISILEEENANINYALMMGGII